MTTDVFIRTYQKDFNWLKYCLNSINKFGQGFRRVIICVPENQVHDIVDGGKDRDYTQELLIYRTTYIKIVTCPVYENDYIGQQISKAQAWLYSDADYILFIDSDCIFTEPFSPVDFIIEGKPVIIKEIYENMKEDTNAYSRKEKMEKWFDKYSIPYEYMRRHPFVYHRNTLINFCASYMDKKKEPMFSEFNQLGYYADANEHGEYCFLEVGKDKLPLPKVKQFWSYGGITPEIKKELEFYTS
jgi:Family of unknown function (DUF6492)